MQLVARRLAQLVAVLVVVTALSYLLISLLPGDPATTILGTSATPKAVATLRHQLHLDQPLPVQYVRWLGHALTGDLGISYLNHTAVGHALATRLPVTLELLVISQILALGVSIPLAILSAYRPGKLVDRATTGGAFLMLSLPSFILGVLLVYVFGVYLKVLPATGFVHITDDFVGNIKTVILPSVTLALGSLAVYVRVLRADMIATLQEDFITVARAKGMPTWHILLRHAFRPSTFSLVTVAGLNVGTLIGGAFIVEYIFALPGVGLYTLTSIYQRDYLAVQGAVVVVAVGYVLVNFCVDMIYPLLDPRTRRVSARA